ncbi:MAG: tRNA (adenosine(37)-N6)-threonylcarbamoyltransferase complex dimerization subunit type 1 TsaB [Gammaproteobacteria bacterium]|nr:tRNA (adenosine(37)-N6)-threonylcarbamoyltransferase complex dimerization subunit type 1 TsaB [Gammaproteobacteria bacterium]
MKLLAIDTTEDACSAALAIDGEIAERFALAPRRHSELILPMMDGLLADAGLALTALDALAFARGPGAFTGLRIAASVVQGAAFGSGLPVVPVSSLHALAQGCLDGVGSGAVLSAFDARMGEVYWGAFRSDAGGIMRPVGDESVAAADAVALPDGAGWRGAGSGWKTYAAALAARCPTAEPPLADAMVHAAAVARLGGVLFAEGRAVDAERALPVYLRDDVAWAKA